MKPAHAFRLSIVLSLLAASACSSESENAAEPEMETGEVIVMDENGIPALKSDQDGSTAVTQMETFADVSHGDTSSSPDEKMADPDRDKAIPAEAR